MGSRLVSVIIPTYNRAGSLKEAVKSVLGQTYTDFELLILDDSSTDNTADIVAGFKDSRIKYMKHQCNIGLVSNWTYGISSAQGVYFCILGDDDVYRPEFLSRRVKTFYEWPDISASTGMFECQSLNGEFLRLSKAPVKEKKVLQGRDLIEFTLGINGEWFNGATLYRTDVVRLMWDKISMAGTALDFSMHIRLSLLHSARVAYVTEPDMILRMHDGQESRRNSFYLAECAAKLSIDLWVFELSKISGRNSALYRKELAKLINHYARMLWDTDRIKDSRTMLFHEIRMYPYNFITWIKLFRTFIEKTDRGLK
jgi:glycosyltransferase involved in cell wall biosynthesis